MKQSTTKGVKSFVDSQGQHRGVTNKPTRMGRVVSIRGSEKVTVFFCEVGNGTFTAGSPDLEQVDSHHPILELAGSVNWNYADRNLYVVELNPKYLIGNDASSKLIYTGFPEDTVSTSE